jgi:hypothetical protein
MRKAHKEMMKLLLYSDLKCTRFLLGVSEILWALILWHPSITFNRPTYHAMAATGLSENAWGFVWAVTGLTQIYILFSGKYHNVFAVCFAGFNMLLWWFVIVGCFLSVGAPAAMSAELGMGCLGSTFIYLRTGWMPRPEEELYGCSGE